MGRNSVQAGKCSRPSALRAVPWAYATRTGSWPSIWTTFSRYPSPSEERPWARWYASMWSPVRRLFRLALRSKPTWDSWTSTQPDRANCAGRAQSRRNSIAGFQREYACQPVGRARGSTAYPHPDIYRSPNTFATGFGRSIRLARDTEPCLLPLSSRHPPRPRFCPRVWPVVKRCGSLSPLSTRSMHRQLSLPPRTAPRLGPACR